MAHGVQQLSYAVPKSRLNPRLFLWFKRISLTLAILILIAVIVQAWRNYRAVAAYDAEIAALQARGELSGPANNEQPLPDSQNAVVYLEKACGLIVFSDAGERDDVDATFRLLLNRPSESDISRSQKWVDANAAALGMVRQARNTPGVYWSAQRSTGLGQYQHDFWHLYRLIRTAACLKAKRGDSAAWTEYLRDQFGTHRILREPYLVEEEQEEPLPGHDSQKLLASMRSRSARASFDALRDELLDDHGPVDFIKRDIRDRRAERASYLPSFVSYDTGIKYAYHWMVHFTEEAQQTDFATRHLRDYDDAERLVDTPFFPSADFSRMRRDAIAPAGSGRFYYGSAADLVDLHFQYAAMRRLAATILAVRFYQADHDGQLPKRPADLVPEYLRELPVDPYDPEHLRTSLQF